MARFLLAYWVMLKGLKGILMLFFFCFLGFSSGIFLLGDLAKNLTASRIVLLSIGMWVAGYLANSLRLRTDITLKKMRLSEQLGAAVAHLVAITAALIFFLAGITAARTWQ